MELFEIIELPNDHFGYRFYNHSGLSIIPVNTNPGNKTSLVRGYGSFLKWVAANHPNIIVNFPTHVDQKIDNRSIDIILPIIHIAKDVTLQTCITLVVDYIKYLIRGKLRKDSAHVTFQVEYSDLKSGKKLRLNYDGPADRIEKIDINKLLD